MRGWGGRQGASDVGLRDARPDADVDERPDRCAACCDGPKGFSVLSKRSGDAVTFWRGQEIIQVGWTSRHYVPPFVSSIFTSHQHFGITWSV